VLSRLAWQTHRVVRGADGSSRLHRLAVTALVLLAAATGVSRAGNLFSLFSTPSGDVFIVTDVTPAGKNFAAPTKEEPIHCQAINFG